MKNAWVLPALAAVMSALFAAWIVNHTRWVEVEEDDPPRGAAVDPHYALRQVLASTGATLEIRTALEPLPPTGATLVLASTQWTVFPERDARLKAWVQGGGDLVVQGVASSGGDTLRWIPIGWQSLPRNTGAAGKAKAAASGASGASGASAASAADAASAASAADATDDDDDESPSTPEARESLTVDWRDCDSFPMAASQPASRLPRVRRSCVDRGVLRALHGEPAWDARGSRGSLALRVPVGRGSVTATTLVHALDDNLGLLPADNALLVAAILQARPGRAVWVVEDEAREPLLLWLWRQARTPLLLCTAATLLALWRLMVRFGPRQALPPRARRSMGEQVRGTGQFIAANDPQALHAATRRAFDDAVSARIEDAAALDDVQRIAALAAWLAPAAVLDQGPLLAALRPGPQSTPAQWLAAAAVLEQARRALLGRPARLPPSADATF